MDVNLIDTSGVPAEALAATQASAAENVKRIVSAKPADLHSPYAIADFLEFKTVWHPMGA